MLAGVCLAMVLLLLGLVVLVFPTAAAIAFSGLSWLLPANGNGGTLVVGFGWDCSRGAVGVGSFSCCCWVWDCFGSSAFASASASASGANSCCCCCGCF